MSRSGRIRRIWAARRRLLVPSLAFSGSWSMATSPVEMRASLGSSRSGKAASINPSGSSAGTSFMLCTARSTLFSKRASSISFTNRPFPPTLLSGASRILSPVVLMMVSSTRTPGMSVLYFVPDPLTLSQGQLAAPGAYAYEHIFSDHVAGFVVYLHLIQKTWRNGVTRSFLLPGYFVPFPGRTEWLL